MSLLNDMLRDLSQHKRVADGVEGYDDELLKASSITQKESQSWLPLVILFVAIFVAVIGVNHFWHKLFNKGVAHDPLQNIVSTKASAIIAPIPVPKAAKGVTEPNFSKETSPPGVELPKETGAAAELQSHIDDLLLQADRAIGMDRLTAPIEDNAYSYYQKILGMSPGNNEAKEGLDKIANRYLLKAQEQMKLGNSSQAEALIQRARFVSERYVQAHEVAVNETETSIAAESNKSVAESQEEKQSVSASTETIKPFPVAEASVISVAPNATWKDEQMARHAQELIQQAKQTEALAQLKGFIVTAQKPAQSAALLAEIYLQQGNTQAANLVVENASYLAEDTKAKLKAQILSANGDDTQAIGVLEKSLTTAENNEAYRSLLASLYHKTANYQQSIISYQRLINSFGEKPAYWLGLALAYDGLSQHKNALQAYQRLREYPQLQEQVKQYTDQRIAALRSE